MRRLAMVLTIALVAGACSSGGGDDGGRGGRGGRDRAEQAQGGDAAGDGGGAGASTSPAGPLSERGEVVDVDAPPSEPDLSGAEDGGTCSDVDGVEVCATNQGRAKGARIVVFADEEVFGTLTFCVTRETTACIDVEPETTYSGTTWTAWWAIDFPFEGKGDYTVSFFEGDEQVLGTYVFDR